MSNFHPDSDSLLLIYKSHVAEKLRRELEAATRPIINAVIEQALRDAMASMEISLQSSYAELQDRFVAQLTINPRR